MTTCGDFASRWPYAYNAGGERWNKATVLGHEYATRRFIAEFGAVPLDGLDVPRAREFAETVTPQIVARLRTMFNDAIADGLAPANPFDRLVRSSNGRKNIVPLTEPELEQLIDVALDVGGRTIAAMVAMAGYVGVRPGELFGMREQDPDPDNLEVSVYVNYNGVEWKRPKNREARPRIILPPAVIPRLGLRRRKPLVCPSCLMARTTEPSCVVCEGTGKVSWLFRNERGRHFRSLNPHWRRIRARFEDGLAPARARELRTARKGRDMSLYELRHTAATLLLDRLEGVGDKYELVAWQLGHKDRGLLVRELYGHPDDDRHRERLKAVFLNGR